MVVCSGKVVKRNFPKTSSCFSSPFPFFLEFCKTCDFHWHISWWNSKFRHPFPGVLSISLTWLGFDTMNYTPKYQQLSILTPGDSRDTGWPSSLCAASTLHMAKEHVTQKHWHSSLLKKRKQQSPKSGVKRTRSLMVLTQKLWAFQRSRRERFLWPKPAYPVPSARKSPYVVAPHSFDVNLEILYPFLPSYFPLTHLVMCDEPQREEGSQ